VGDPIDAGWKSDHSLIGSRNWALKNIQGNENRREDREKLASWMLEDAAQPEGKQGKKNPTKVGGGNLNKNNDQAAATLTKNVGMQPNGRT